MAKLVNWTVAEYEAETTRLRSTSLKAILGPHGPREWYLRETGQLQIERREGDHFDLGTLLHDAILQSKRDWFIYDKRRIGKEFDAAKADNPGKIAIKTSDEQVLLAMYESVMRNKDARRLIENSAAEQTFLWDDETGITCKARADIYCPNGTIADIKTWTSRNGQCTPERFFWHVEDLGYHHSAAFYEAGRDACVGKMNAPFIHIAVFKKPPYWCYVWPLSDYALDVARRDVRKGLDLLHQCQQNEMALLANGQDGAAAYPDPMLADQGLGYTPSDSWLARNDYGYV